MPTSTEYTFQIRAGLASDIRSVNALPYAPREFIHDLETNVDPDW
jgi:hypothetical protein